MPSPQFPISVTTLKVAMQLRKNIIIGKFCYLILVNAELDILFFKIFTL